MSRPYDISDIAAMLASRINALVAELLPAGIREGHEWRIGSVAGEPGRSMAVHLSGAKAGVWKDWAADIGGDALDLVAAVLFRDNKAQAVRWSRAWLGVDDADPASFERRRAEAVKRREEASDDDERRRRRAMALFLEAQPLLADTPASAYLTNRAIDLAQLGRPLRALRFHRALYNAESGREWPALVAAITNIEGELAAVHRTWLLPDGSGKAPLSNPKMSLGHYAGGCIRLWRGASGKPMKDAPVGDVLVIAEGIEDGLSVALATPEHRVISAVSLSNMAAIALPPAISTIIIAAQNDPPGSLAERALNRAVAEFLAQGRRVKIARPPPGIKDLNQLLQFEMS